MVDRKSKALELGLAWMAFGNHVAVVVALGVALVSLSHRVPVRVASMRGALAFLGVWAIVRASHALLARVAREPNVAPNVMRNVAPDATGRSTAPSSRRGAP